MTPTPLVTISAPKKYDLIYIDPPWSYTNFGTASASSHYGLMSQQDICNMDLKSILNKDGMVLVWATGPRMNYAIDAINAWGLHYRGVAFVWVKTRKDGVVINGQGVPPTFTKPMAEFVLCATTKKAGRPIKLQKFNTPQIVMAPREGHSTKPQVFRTHIETTLTPNIAKLEVFARAVTLGWDAIGNGVCGEDVSVSISKLNGSISCSPTPHVVSVTSTDQCKNTETPQTGDQSS